MDAMDKALFEGSMKAHLKMITKFLPLGVNFTLEFIYKPGEVKAIVKQIGDKDNG